MLHPNLKALLKEPSVFFNATNHTYPHKITGELYKGCTTIADLADKPFLAPWYAKEMANYLLSCPYDVVHEMSPKDFEKFVTDGKKAAPDIADKAKKDGTAAHDWIEGSIAASVDPAILLPGTPDSKQACNAIDAFCAWKKQHEIIWLASEEIVSSDIHRTAGRVDAVAIVDGIPSIVDFKTSGQISASYPLQCAGYHMMLREMGFTVRQWIILRLPKDGADFETLTISDQKDMQFFEETFLHHLEAHKYQVYLANHYTDSTTRKLRVDAA